NMDERLDDVYEPPVEACPPSPSLPQDFDEWCTFVNDTKYTVMITDKDGTRPLKPGKSTTNVGIPGFKIMDDTSDKEVEFDPDDMETMYVEEEIMPEDLIPLEADSQVDRDKSETREEQKWCTFENDTKYTVMITDKDGTRPLKPGKSTMNLNISGFETGLDAGLDGKIWTAINIDFSQSNS
ncbi:hypothetical protein AWC38_SpisGene21972, partial [Stylophora pistillata]